MSKDKAIGWFFRKPKFKGFRRTHWLVGDPAKREEHSAALEAGLPVGGLTRTWREGEPVMRVKHAMKP